LYFKVFCAFLSHIIIKINNNCELRLKIGIREIKYDRAVLPIVRDVSL